MGMRFEEDLGPDICLFLLTGDGARVRLDTDAWKVGGAEVSISSGSRRESSAGL